MRLAGTEFMNVDARVDLPGDLTEMAVMREVDYLPD